MSMQLTIFRTPFGNKEAKNQIFIFAFSLTDKNFTIVVVNPLVIKVFFFCHMQVYSYCFSFLCKNIFLSSLSCI